MVRIQTGHKIFLPLQVCGRFWRGLRLVICTRHMDAGVGRGSGERGTQEGGLRTEAGGGCVEKEVWRRYGGGRLGERGWSNPLV